MIVSYAKNKTRAIKYFSVALQYIYVTSFINLPFYLYRDTVSRLWLVKDEGNDGSDFVQAFAGCEILERNSFVEGTDPASHGY